jgi:hypothetical protein
VTFDEEAVLKKSRRCQLEEVYEEEPVNPRIAKSMKGGSQSCRTSEGSHNFPDEELLEDHDIVEVQEPPQMTFSHKRKPCLGKLLSPISRDN